MNKLINEVKLTVLAITEDFLVANGSTLFVFSALVSREDYKEAVTLNIAIPYEMLEFEIERNNYYYVEGSLTIIDNDGNIELALKASKIKKEE